MILIRTGSVFCVMLLLTTIFSPLFTSAQTVTSKFAVGDRVQTTDTLNVRAIANTSGTLLGTQSIGAQGTVVGGPTSQGGYNWWNVNYDNGVDGWSVESYLIKAVTATTQTSSSENWIRIDNGDGNIGAYFRRPVMLPNGNIWAAWGSYKSTGNGSRIFNQSNKTWEATSVSSGSTEDIGLRENYGAWYDNGIIRIGSGAPVAYGFPPASPPYPQWGDVSFNLSTKKYSLDRGDANAFAKADGAYIAHNGTLYAFGGWTRGSAQELRKLSGGVASNINGSVTPPWTEEGSRLSYSRSGVDSRNGMLWTLADDYELYRHNGSSGTWVHSPTTGTKPSHEYGIATLDESKNRIIVWLSSDGIVGPADAVQKTYVLNLTTYVWTEVSTSAKPTSVPQSANNLLYNPVLKIAQLVIDTKEGTQVWNLGTGTTPPLSSDATPPVVSLTAPAIGATLSGSSATISATASDNIGVVGVQFKLNGTNLLSEDTTAPYSITWNTIGASNGVHTLTATARDAGGNMTTSSGVNVTVSNTTTTTPPPAPITTTVGTITSFALPALVGAPYSTLTSSKHTNMAYSPATNRLYVTGGDWVNSGTDGTWSMDMTNGSWRQDVGNPVYPTTPAPHALQDGAGFVWVQSKSKFLIWPGSYYPYEAAGSAIRNYSKGIWWFDPVTNKFTQELGLFGTEYTGSGNPHGGVYDEVNGDIVVFLDNSSGGPAVRRWDVATLTKLPDIPITLSSIAGKPGNAFTRGLYTKIGRYVYVAGFSHDGTGSGSQVARFWRWHLDNLTFEELAAPPFAGSLMKDLETRLGNSNGKVVWPLHNGPDGTILGIYVYDPAKNTWATDSQVPSYGNFIGNAVTSLPDGRVAFSGGVFGKQQTHMWFYTANGGTVTAPPATNITPTANAGTDKAITLPVTSAGVVGSAIDQDGSIASTVWSFVKGPGTGTVTNGTTLSPTFSNMTIAGTYVFRLTVTDNKGATASDDVQIVVSAGSVTPPVIPPVIPPATPNLPPTANAGTDKAITLPVMVVRPDEAKGTDKDGTIASMVWSFYSGPATTTAVAINTAPRRATFIGMITPGTYVFRLTVTDDKGATAYDDMTVVVSPAVTVPPVAPNTSPTANAGQDKALTLPTANTGVVGSATDSDGTIASTAWSFVSGPSTPSITNGTTLSPTFSSLSTAGTYVFRLTATDNKGAVATDDMQVVVSAAAVVPPVVSNLPPTANAGTDKAITLPVMMVRPDEAKGTDKDGTITSMAWSFYSGPSTAVVVVAPQRTTFIGMITPGTYVFRLTVTDDKGATAYDDMTVVVSPAKTTSVTTPTPITKVVAGNVAGASLTPFRLLLKFGDQNADVTRLQEFLIQNGYLEADSMTGYFGIKTQTALSTYQCKEGIVCEGDPTSTGYGMFGPKTLQSINRKMGY